MRPAARPESASSFPKRITFALRLFLPGKRPKLERRFSRTFPNRAKSRFGSRFCIDPVPKPLGYFQHYKIIMTSPLPCGFARSLQLALILLTGMTTVQAQNLKTTLSPAATDRNGDLQKQSAAHFLRGRRVPGQSAAELRRRAYVAKMKMRTARTTSAVRAMRGRANLMENTSGTWTPLGPAPLASDASGNGSQDYGVVSGRATAVAVDPADPSGNTVFIGAAQGGIWKSINAANSNAALVTWIPVADNQETLSIGSLAIQPGNADPAGSVILAATGEGNNSANSYFGLGILRSADGGDTWTLISTANGGTLSFSGLGGSRMAFSTASAQTNTVVSAMATTEEGAIDGAVTGNTARGLYTSIDAGQDWTYDALLDPGGAATDATSATGVAYNGAAGLFFASVRYHGFYSSPDGTNWTRLVNQPGGALLSTSACPPLSTENFQTCPIFRGEISVVPGHNEMYAWFLSLDSFGNPVDEGIWQSTNSGATWIAMNDSGITNCGDPSGCGVAQGIYNLELLAVPNGGAATDLYAGAVNLFKCSITSINPTCANSPFLNLTHAYGCPVIAELAHVHPSRHALAFALPAAPGVYNLIATAQDASGHPIHTATIPLTVIQDFSLSSSTATQTVSPGQSSGAYNLTLQPNPPGSSFPSPITLTCSGLPALAQCIFEPSAPVSLGNSSASVVLNISTIASTGSLQPGRGIVLAWAD
jgi:hypothetical protein